MTSDCNEGTSSHSSIRFRDPFSRARNYEIGAMQELTAQVDALEKHSAELGDNSDTSPRKEVCRSAHRGQQDPKPDTTKHSEVLQQYDLGPGSEFTSDDDGSYTPTSLESTVLCIPGSELNLLQSNRVITSQDTLIEVGARTEALVAEDEEDFGTLIVGVDGGVDNMESGIPSRHRLCPVPSTSFPFPIVRSTSFSLSVEGSNISMQSYGDLGDDDNWDPDRLLELSDLVREVLRGTISLCNEHVEILLVVLKAMVRSEQVANGMAIAIDMEVMVGGKKSAQAVTNTIDIDAIKDSHFDKLLHDIRHAGGLMLESRIFQEVRCEAEILEAKWTKRFRSAYTSLDYDRGEDMLKFGELRDITLNPKVSIGAVPWIFKNARTIADHEGGLSFVPGDWWLNIECAMRDGIVGTVDQAVTKGRYGATALTLLTGEEEDVPALHMYQYTKIGNMKDMLFGLLLHRDPLRILRGSNLKSKYAPLAGIRYDGLYLLRQYGHKLIDQDENVYRCSLILDRVPGQKSFNDALRVPYPSQIDNWNCYCEIISKLWTRKDKGLGYSNWFEIHGQQQREKQEWLRNKNIKDGLKKFTMISRELFN